MRCPRLPGKVDSEAGRGLGQEALSTSISVSRRRDEGQRDQLDTRSVGTRASPGWLSKISCLPFRPASQPTQDAHFPAPWTWAAGSRLVPALLRAGGDGQA